MVDVSLQNCIPVIDANGANRSKIRFLTNTTAAGFSSHGLTFQQQSRLPIFKTLACEKEKKSQNSILDNYTTETGALWSYPDNLNPTGLCTNLGKNSPEVKSMRMEDQRSQELVAVKYEVESRVLYIIRQNSWLVIVRVLRSEQLSSQRERSFGVPFRIRLNYL